jgi:hypothetical protein
MNKSAMLIPCTAEEFTVFRNERMLTGDPANKLSITYDAGIVEHLPNAGFENDKTRPSCSLKYNLK